MPPVTSFKTRLMWFFSTSHCPLPLLWLSGWEIMESSHNGVIKLKSSENITGVDYQVSLKDQPAPRIFSCEGTITGPFQILGMRSRALLKHGLAFMKPGGHSNSYLIPCFPIFNKGSSLNTLNTDFPPCSYFLQTQAGKNARDGLSHFFKPPEPLPSFNTPIPKVSSRILKVKLEPSALLSQACTLYGVNALHRPSAALVGLVVPVCSHPSFPA